MDNPQIIPDENIETPPSSSGSVRPGTDTPLTIPATEEDKEVILKLLSDGYPEAPQLGQLTPNMLNVESYEVEIKPEGSTTWEPLDLDGDGVPDVRITRRMYFQSIFC